LFSNVIFEQNDLKVDLARHSGTGLQSQLLGRWRQEDFETEANSRKDPETLSQKQNKAGGHWLTPVILVTRESEIRRITVRSQPRQIILETLS
jgi:hypothetical protein